MKKNLFFALLALMVLPSVAAERKDSVKLAGVVEAYFTYELLPATTVEILQGDSVLTTTETYGISESYDYTTSRMVKHGGNYEVTLPGAGFYTVRARRSGYQTVEIPVRVPARKGLRRVAEWTQNIIMKKVPKRGERLLGEAVVQATKIKVVLKGDTVVYNADAFELSDGSMLEDLIHELPDVRLEDDQIYYKDKSVSELLINGRSFFKGDMRVALENLPAYTVDKVKVYNKENDDAYLVRDSQLRNKHRHMVMDVNLKRQYSTGWIANAEVAGGTKERFLMRAFGMRYTNHSRLGVYANANNVGGVRSPSARGDWGIQSNVPSNSLYRTAGVNFGWDHKRTKVEYDGKLLTAYDRTDQEGTTMRETYYATGDQYYREHHKSRQRKTDIDVNNTVKWPAKGVFVSLQHHYLFSKTRAHGFSRNATLDSVPEETSRTSLLRDVFAPVGSSRWYNYVVNRVEDLNQWERTSHSTDGTLTTTLRSPFSDNTFNVTFKGSYQHTDYTLFSHYDLRYVRTDKTSFRNNYILQPSEGYSYSAELRLPIVEKKTRSLNVSYLYQHTSSRNSQDYYRLDGLNGWDSVATAPALGLLPSTRELLLQTMDVQNTYRTTNKEGMHYLTLDGKITLPQKGKFTKRIISMTLPMQMRARTVDDVRPNVPLQHLSDHQLLMHPSITFEQGYERKKGPKDKPMEQTTTSRMIMFRYAYQMMPSRLASQLNVINTTDPLNTYAYNVKLKNAANHSLMGAFSFNKTRAPQFNLNVYADFRQNDQANLRKYDAETGVTTWMPRNINGNYSITAAPALSFTLNRKKNMTLHTNCSTSYGHSVDYSGVNLQGESTRSVVHNWRVSPGLRFSSMMGKYNFNGSLQTAWIHQVCGREGFSEVNAWETNLGISAGVKAIKRLVFESTVQASLRRGYASKVMNDTYWVWNVAVTRSFLKDRRLIGKIEAIDLLRQRHNTQQVINAQGKTETWVNTIPSYVIMRWMYNFNLLPKKKDGGPRKTPSNTIPGSFGSQYWM